MAVFLRPGEGFKTFTVKKKSKILTETGKPVAGGYVTVGPIIAILATATQKEKEEWKQKGHPISHKIVQRGINNAAVATNYIVLSEKGKKDRYFYVQGATDPAELHHIMRYYVEERKDLKNG